MLFDFLIQCCVVESEKFRRVPLIPVEFAEHFYQNSPFEGIHEIFQVDFFIHEKILDEKIDDGFSEFMFALFIRCSKVQIALFVDVKNSLREACGQSACSGFEKINPALRHYPFNRRI